MTCNVDHMQLWHVRITCNEPILFIMINLIQISVLTVIVDSSATGKVLALELPKFGHKNCTVLYPASLKAGNEIGGSFLCLYSCICSLLYRDAHPPYYFIHNEIIVSWSNNLSACSYCIGSTIPTMLIGYHHATKIRISLPPYNPCWPFMLYLNMLKQYTDTG